MPDLLGYARDYLIAQNVVRKPSVAGAAPPLWLEPREGVNAPGEGENDTEKGADAVLGVFIAGTTNLGRHEGFRRIDFIDFVIRVRTAPMIWPIDASLRTALHDKRGWDMAGKYVMESLIFRELQRYPPDAQGWTFMTSFSIETLTQ